MLDSFVAGLWSIDEKVCDARRELLSVLEGFIHGQSRVVDRDHDKRSLTIPYKSDGGMIIPVIQNH
ncbi:hypothetical protein D3C85_1423760 [compost metagenome]